MDLKLTTTFLSQRQLFGMVGNVVMVIFFGGRYEYEDEVSKQIYDTFKDM